MSVDLSKRIGTRATDTEPPVWPTLDQNGEEYVKNGIATVNLSPTKFAVVRAGQDPNRERIDELKAYVSAQSTPVVTRSTRTSSGHTE